MRLRTVGGLMIVSLLGVACGITEPTPETTRAPVVLTLTAEIAECDSIGGCRAYASINRAGDPVGPETRLTGLGQRGTQGLPPSLDPGSYTVHFRLVAVSDAVLNGQRAEATLATCDADLVAPGDELAAEVELVVTFQSDSCAVTPRVTFANGE